MDNRASPGGGSSFLPIAATEEGSSFRLAFRETQGIVGRTRRGRRSSLSYLHPGGVAPPNRGKGGGRDSGGDCGIPVCCARVLAVLASRPDDGIPAGRDHRPSQPGNGSPERPGVRIFRHRDPQRPVLSGHNGGFPGLRRGRRARPGGAGDQPRPCRR